jgi:transcriptional regulator with XRE-family HTH domain
MEAQAHAQFGYKASRYRAYLSEPITRCPVREKGRIQTLVLRMAESLALDPYHTSLYIPSLVTAPERRSDMSPEHVYLLDRIRIVQADFVLVIADHASFGIGGEVEIASSLGKPVLFLSREERVSRFLLGSPVNALRSLSPENPHFLHYRDWRDLKPRLLPAIHRLLTQLAEAQAHQLPFWDLGSSLKQLRNQHGWSARELARRAGLHEQQILLWEKGVEEIRRELDRYRFEDGEGLGPVELSPRQLEQLVNPGLDALHRLSHVLGVSLETLVGEPSEATARPKGPAKELEQWLQQLARTRGESLRARADQFDVTYREYQVLKNDLQDGLIERLEQGKILPSPALHHISEEEFLHELRRLRARR